MQIINTVTCMVASWMVMSSHAYLYNPYQQLYRYSYPSYNPLTPYFGNHLQQGFTPANFLPQGYTPANFLQQSFPPLQTSSYGQLYPNNILSAYPRPLDPPLLNLIAEEPHAIKNRFSVVPLVALANEDLNIIANPLVIQVSKSKPTMRVKTEDDKLVQCIPSVKINLDTPLSLYSLKQSMVFPSEIDILHDGFKITIKVGALVAPVARDYYISPETPALVHVLYAVPTKPIPIDVSPNNDTVINQDNQSVAVETNDEDNQPPKNITVVDFPSVEAEPIFEVDEEDEELVNRNPPEPVIPAGIVQSTQPLITVQQFTNSKESPLLTLLREQAAKDRLKHKTPPNFYYRQ